jgi:hypothetical protein
MDTFEEVLPCLPCISPLQLLPFIIHSHAFTGAINIIILSACCYCTENLSGHMMGSLPHLLLIIESSAKASWVSELYVHQVQPPRAGAMQLQHVQHLEKQRWVKRQT